MPLQNFRALCTGEKGNTKGGKALHYKVVNNPPSVCFMFLLGWLTFFCASMWFFCFFIEGSVPVFNVVVLCRVASRPLRQGSVFHRVIPEFMLQVRRLRGL